jgi:hypothetical protein
MPHRVAVTVHEACLLPPRSLRLCSPLRRSNPEVLQILLMRYGLACRAHCPVLHGHWMASHGLSQWQLNPWRAGAKKVVTLCCQVVAVRRRGSQPYRWDEGSDTCGPSRMLILERDDGPLGTEAWLNVELGVSELPGIMAICQEGPEEFFVNPVPAILNGQRGGCCHGSPATWVSLCQNQAAACQSYAHV